MGEAGPLDAQSLPRVLELAASKAADFTAFNNSGKAPDLNTLGSNLYLEGEVMREKLTFPQAVLIISDENPGAQRLAGEVQTKYPDLVLTTHEKVNLQLKPVGRSFVRSGTANRRSAWKRDLAAGGDGSGERNRFYLLYLNNLTWLGAPGIKLAEQVPRPPHVGRTPSHAPSAPCAAPLQPRCSPTAAPLQPRCSDSSPSRFCTPGAGRAEGGYLYHPRARERPGAGRLRIRDLLPHDTAGLCSYSYHPHAT